MLDKLFANPEQQIEGVWRHAVDSAGQRHWRDRHAPEVGAGRQRARDPSARLLRRDRPFAEHAAFDGQLAMKNGYLTIRPASGQRGQTSVPGVFARRRRRRPGLSTGIHHLGGFGCMCARYRVLDEVPKDRKGGHALFELRTHRLRERAAESALLSQEHFRSSSSSAPTRRNCRSNSRLRCRSRVRSRVRADLRQRADALDFPHRPVTSGGLPGDAETLLHRFQGHELRSLIRPPEGEGIGPNVRLRWESSAIAGV